MEFINHPTILLGLLLFVLLHLASAITRGIISKTLNYANLGLHIVFLIPMMTLAIPIEEAVLVYMISVFSYAMICNVRYRRIADGQGDAARKNPEAKKVAEPRDASDVKAQAADGVKVENTERENTASAQKKQKNDGRQDAEKISTVEAQARERELRGITADSSPIKGAGPIVHEYEPIRIEKPDGKKPLDGDEGGRK